MLRLCDLSSHNPGVDFDALATWAAGAFVKNTEGLGYVNPLAAAQLAGLRARGMVVGHYHYARQDTGDTPEAECDDFVAHADVRPGELLALDFETAGGADPAGWADAYLTRLDAHFAYAQALIYTYRDYIAAWLRDARLATRPLWLADYNGGQTWPAAPAPWSAVTLWQDAGDVAGLPGCPDPVDTNRYNGTREDLMALTVPGVVAVAHPDDATSSARLLAYYRALPPEAQGSALPGALWEGHADFGGVAGAPWPEGHLLHTEYFVLWTWPGQPVRWLQPETFAALRAAGKVVVYG